MAACVSDPRVLVVDDDPLFANLARRVLARLGIHCVETASSGRKALDRLDGRHDQFDLLLCDLEMAEMDGVELLRHLAERRFSGGIVVISGQDKRVIDSVVDLADSHHLNVVGALHKPFALNALLALLERVFESTPEARVGTLPEVSHTELARAIAAGEIAVHYQPQMEISSGRITGVEALARWQHSDRGAIGPGVFVPLAEQHGLVVELSESVIAQALNQCRAWLDVGIELGVAVNLPADMLVDLSLADRLAEDARNVGVSPSQVTVEMTETQLMCDARRALETLNRLRLKGIRLAIDDFGTGYSSLSQLRLVPFQELKVDKGFVQRAPQDPVSHAIVESSVELARRLGMRVIAEGIETADQLALIARLGCDGAQGYYIARPMSGGEVREWLRDRARSTAAG